MALSWFGQGFLTAWVFLDDVLSVGDVVFGYLTSASLRKRVLTA